MMGENVNKTWTSKEIRSYMKDFVSKMDKDDRETIGDVIDTIEISVDGRLKSSMGYFTGKYKRNGEFISPVKFKFSKRINLYDNNTVKHIIQHELIHLLSDKKHGRNTSHDKEWQECCHKYGVNDSQFFTPNLELEKDYHRYLIYCNECGKLIEVKNRLSKTSIIELLLYSKHRVDGGKLKIYDNKEQKYLRIESIMVNDSENY